MYESHGSVFDAKINKTSKSAEKQANVCKCMKTTAASGMPAGGGGGGRGRTITSRGGGLGGCDRYHHPLLLKTVSNSTKKRQMY